jgi:LysR family transcriptional regulator, regulator for genes of the gallate degradation pathway
VLQVPLFEDQPVVIGRAGHPLAGMNNPAASDLAAFPWTISAPGTPLRLLWESMFDRARVALPVVPVECGSVIAIRQMLLDSDLLTLLSPDQVAVELEAGWLTRIGEPPAELRRTIGLTARSGWRPTATQQNFIDLLNRSLS